MSTINVNQRDSVRQAWKAIKGIMFFVGIIIVLLILFSLSTFTVGEAEQVVVMRLGKIDRVILDPEIHFLEQNSDLQAVMGDGNNVSVIYKKGLFFKFPFIDQVKMYDSRLQTYISQEEEINTNDKKKYSVRLYAQWRIANPALFYKKYMTLSRATQVLDNTIYPTLIQQINRMQATDFLSNKDLLNESLVESLKQMNIALREGGIEVADVQVNRTSLPPANLQSTYDRMVANRQKVAQQYRSEGQETNQKAMAEADLEASRIIAEATRKSKEIKGAADAQALEIYANSYSKDPEFYGYWRSLQAMKESLGGSTIVLDRDHPLWKDLLDMISQGKITAK